MYTEEEINLITLCSFDYVSYNECVALYFEFCGNLPDFVKFDGQLIKRVPRGVYNKVKESFFSGEYRKSILKEYEEKGIKCVTALSENYPENLKQIPSPPLTLFCRGNVNLLTTRCFSVVGSRRTLPNIGMECKKICSQLTQHFTVVTGVADGADSKAIEGAVDSGKLICVLAYGFDYYYPAVNKTLIKKVESKGLVITEYPPQVQVRRFQFPVRNRIIAGLSEATLIVSAGERSGALLTANNAVNYNRHVFAFPYGLGVAAGSGCNGLIKKGALLAENILDIFSVFGLDFKEPERVVLSEEESRLFGLIKESGEVFTADLANKLNKAQYEIIPILSSLEIKGKIARLGGNRYGVL